MKLRVLFSIAILAIAMLALSGCAKEKAEVGGREISAIVNGEKIFVDEVNSEYETLTPEQQKSITKADALSFIIERKILSQEAGRQKIGASDNEVNYELELYLRANNITEVELKRMLAERSSSIEDFKGVLRQQIAINKLLDKVVPTNFAIKRGDVERAYNASGLAARNISFNQSELSLVQLLKDQMQITAKSEYIESLKSKADVLIVAVPN